jgi:hypothetical protein
MWRATHDHRDGGRSGGAAGKVSFTFKVQVERLDMAILAGAAFTQNASNISKNDEHSW